MQCGFHYAVTVAWKMRTHEEWREWEDREVGQQRDDVIAPRCSTSEAQINHGGHLSHVSTPLVDR